MSNSKPRERLQNKRKDEKKVGVVREKAQFGACRKVYQIWRGAKGQTLVSALTRCYSNNIIYRFDFAELFGLQEFVQFSSCSIIPYQIRILCIAV